MFRLALACALVAAAMANFAPVAVSTAPVHGHGLAGYGAGAAYNFHNFMGYWKQYNTGYNPWFVNYCNSYLTSHPTGKFVPYVRQYLTSFGGAGYGPTAGAAIVGGAAYGPTEAIVGGGAAYGPTGAIVGGDAYGAGPNNFHNFMGYWKQYNTGYNPWFVNYCNSYLTSHPTGKYVRYVRQYLTSFGGAGYGPTGAIVGGDAYGPTEAIVGGAAYGPTGAIVGGAAYGPTGAIVGGDAYGAGPYNFKNFMGYYKQYHGGYSKYFLDYCNNYVQTHPRGQYFAQANKYINQYAGYGPTGALVGGPAYGPTAAGAIVGGAAYGPTAAGAIVGGAAYGPTAGAIVGGAAYGPTHATSQIAY